MPLESTSRATRVARLLVLLLIGAGLAANLAMTSKLIDREMRLVADTWSLSREAKMRRRVGAWLYDFLGFVRSSSPERSVILIPPPSGRWFITSNAHMVYYYVYPREVVNAPAEDTEAAIREYLQSHPGVTHILITSEGGSIWPGISYRPADEVVLQSPGWGIVKLGR